MGAYAKMSIEIFKKLFAVTELENAERVIFSLISSGCVEFKRSDPITDRNPPVLYDYLKEFYEATHHSNISLSEITTSIRILSEYSDNSIQPSKKVATSRIKRQTVLFLSDDQILRTCNTINETLKLSKALEDLTAETSRLESDIERLLPWESYSEPLSFKGTESTCFFFGSIPVAFDIEEIIQKLNDLCACIQPISWDTSVYYVRLIAHRESCDEVLDLLSEYEFKIKDYDNIDLRANVALSAARKRLITIEGERIRKEERLAYLSKDLDNIKLFYDHIATLEICLEISRGVPIGETSAYIEAVIPAFCIDKINEILDSNGCAYEFSNPDKSYTIVKNSKFAKKHDNELLKYIKAQPQNSLKEVYSQSGKEFIPVTPSELYTEE